MSSLLFLPTELDEKVSWQVSTHDPIFSSDFIFTRDSRQIPVKFPLFFKTGKWRSTVGLSK